MGKHDHPPVPPVVNTYQIGVSLWSPNPIDKSKVVGIIYPDDHTGPYFGTLNEGRDLMFTFSCPPSTYAWGAGLHIEVPGFKNSDTRVLMQQGSYDINLELPFPSPLSRDSICKPIKFYFGGTYFTHSTLGVIPYFDACLAWLSEVDRKSVYDMKRGNGESHIIIELPNGYPLYDEYGQPYNPDNFPALDMTSYETGIDKEFLDIIAEVIIQGFTPAIFLDERYEHSSVLMPLLLNALKTYEVDLTPYVIVSPGWDGVFYGWDPSLIVKWSQDARAISPNIVLAMEHNIGHIPLGEGGGDYAPNGRMQGYDIILGEFQPWIPYGNLPQDQVWQVVARMGCPEGYHRPPEQPSGDDPSPPFYLNSPTSRGRFYYWVFETGMYEWVRGAMTVEQFAEQRAYYKQLNCEIIN